MVYDTVMFNKYDGVAMSKLTNTEFFSKLESRPDLLEHFKRLFSIAESTGSESIRRADDAEETVTQELRALGKDLLNSWAQTQENESVKNLKNSMNGVKPHSKKNCTGTRVTEKLKS